MAFARHNIEKRRLIDLVRQNPILWDCRLPHYKRSDKRKANKWAELGRLFGVNGARVQRTFTSLRETFRRELNQEKVLDGRFQSKWVYFGAMSFLKEVIRERKSRERPRTSEQQKLQIQALVQVQGLAQSPQLTLPKLPTLPTLPTQPLQGINNNINNNNNNNKNNNNNNNNNMLKNGIDEYQYFPPNHPNNPSNRQQLQQQLQHKQLHHALQQQQPPQLPHDVVLSLSALSAFQKLGAPNSLGVPQHQVHAQPPVPPLQLQQLQQPLPQSLLTPPMVAISTPTSRSASSTPSFCIKDEPDSQDDIISLATTIRHDEKYNGDGDAMPLLQASSQPQPPPPPPMSPRHARLTPQQQPQLRAVPCVQAVPPAALLARDQPEVGGRAIRCSSHVVLDELASLNGDDDPLLGPPAEINVDVDADCDGEDDGDGDGDGDCDYGDDDVEGDDFVAIDDGLLSIGSSLSKQSLNERCLYRSYSQGHGPRRIVEHRPSPREILYTKFGDFLAVRLNTLQESVANELMNKILMMVAEK